jgi:hypothetical protein
VAPSAGSPTLGRKNSADKGLPYGETAQLYGLSGPGADTGEEVADSEPGSEALGRNPRYGTMYGMPAQAVLRFSSPPRFPPLLALRSPSGCAG